MDFSLKDLVILGIALWVTFNLPRWSRKFAPEGISGWKMPPALRLIVQVFIAWLFAKIGWSFIADGIDDALSNLREIAVTEQISRVVKLPEIILGVGAIVLTLWLFKTLFESLADAKTGTDTIVAIVVLVVFMAGYNMLWIFLRKYLLLNLEGSELLFQTESWKIVETFFNSQ